MVILLEETAATLANDKNDGPREERLLLPLGHKIRRLKVRHKGTEMTIADLGVGSSSPAKKHIMRTEVRDAIAKRSTAFLCRRLHRRLVNVKVDFLGGLRRRNMSITSQYRNSSGNGRIVRINGGRCLRSLAVLLGKDHIARSTPMTIIRCRRMKMRILTRIIVAKKICGIIFVTTGKRIRCPWVTVSVVLVSSRSICRVV
mmetsp:Transcript_17593/g.35341  ORF Transcript_17593/g.35341 Transcript_17593/m.35341 type:complete len:201 (+) Transcript_17593:1465-2067(+)